jgi:hypothetical protein
MHDSGSEVRPRFPSWIFADRFLCRGWTAIQLREGDNLSCEGALIEDNKIGPAGEEWIIEMDGEDPENSPRGRPLASGLSIACRGSTVVRNVSPDCAIDGLLVY